MPGLVTSFIPGRIRLRGRIFRDREITAALILVLEGTGAVTSIDINHETGSVLVRYRAEALPEEETLKRRLAEFAKGLPDYDALRVKVALYRPEDRPALLEAAQRLKEALPAIIAR